MRTKSTGACSSEPAIHDDVRGLLGALGRDAQVFNVYSAGDSGEGCEVIEFTTPCSGGRVPWTALIYVDEGVRFAVCSPGW